MQQNDSIAPCKTSKQTDGEAYAKDRLSKSKKKVLFVKVCYIFILITSIVIIWATLFSPILIGRMSMPSSDNITRPFYDLLINHSDIACDEYNQKINKSGSLCPDLYVFKCPMCLPICGVWHPLGDGYFKAYRIIAIIVGVINFTFSTFGIIVAVRVPGSLSFPRINYLFIFLSLIYLSIPFIIISIMGPHRFFCALRNEDFETVASSPSVLVTAFGAIVHYSFISFDISFVLAAFNIFILIFFPHWQIPNSAKKKRLLVIVELSIFIFVPFLFPLAHLAIHRQYSFTRLPLLPFPISEGFTPIVLVLAPLWLLTGISLTLIALSIYRVKIMQYVLHQTIVKFKSYEIRHILFAIQVGFTVSFIFMEQAIQSANQDVSDFLLEDFWACVTLQNNPQFISNQSLIPLQCPATYKDYYLPVLTMLRYITNCLYAVEILVLLMTKETYDAWGRTFRKVLTPINVIFTSVRKTSSTS